MAIWLPTIEVALNLTSASLAIAAVRAIRQGKRERHKSLMLAALGSSTVFLACYLFFHVFGTPLHFSGPSWLHVLYLVLLIPHTLLAVAVVPMIFLTVRHAWREDFTKHRQAARWTYPVWLFVSFSGVVVYVFLYGSVWLQDTPQ